MKQALKNIEKIIRQHGFFRYLVIQEITPRYSYTIGLTDSIGFELIVGGMIYFKSNEELESIFQAISKLLLQNITTRNFNLKELGCFKMVEVDNTWISFMMLGAIDYYNNENIKAFQIVPTDVEKLTIDIPDMSQKWNQSNIIWKYLDEALPWTYNIPNNSTALTNLAALKGFRLTEYFRFEIDEWEIFAGDGSQEPKESIRIVPISVMIGLDNSIENFINDPVGKGKYRDISDENNNTWYDWE